MRGRECRPRERSTCGAKSRSAKSVDERGGRDLKRVLRTYYHLKRPKKRDAHLITWGVGCVQCAYPIGALVFEGEARRIPGLVASLAYASVESLATRSTRCAELMPPAAGSAHGACCPYCCCPPGRALGESESELRCCAIGCCGITLIRGVLLEPIIG